MATLYNTAACMGNRSSRFFLIVCTFCLNLFVENKVPFADSRPKLKVGIQSCFSSNHALGPLPGWGLWAPCECLPERVSFVRVNVYILRSPRRSARKSGYPSQVVPYRDFDHVRGFPKRGCAIPDNWKTARKRLPPTPAFPRLQQRAADTLWIADRFCAKRVPTRMNKGARFTPSSTPDASSTRSTIALSS